MSSYFSVCSKQIFAPHPTRWILLSFSSLLLSFILPATLTSASGCLFHCSISSLILTAHTFNLTVLPSCAFTVFLRNIYWDSLLTSKLLRLYVRIPNCLSFFSTLYLLSIFMFLCLHSFSPYIQTLSHVVPSKKANSLVLWTAMTCYLSILL